MATAAEVKTAYKGVIRADLNDAVAQAVADAINNGTTSLDAYISGLIQQAGASTVPAVAMAAFFDGVTPTSARTDTLSAFSKTQFDSYTKLGVGNPALGPFEAIGRGYAIDATTKAAFQTKYGALSDADFLVVAYTSVFGAAANAGATANLQSQLNYFKDIYTKAGISAADAALQARGAVLGQIVGYAFTDATAGKSAILDDQVTTFLTNVAKGDTTGYGKALPPASPGGTSFVFTTGIDLLVGTGGADTFIGDFGIANQVTAADSVNGGAGTDTLKLFGALGALPGTISGVEILNLVNPGNNNINVAAVSGLTTLKVDQVDAAGGKTFTVGNGVAVDVATLSGADAGGTLTVALSATDTTGNLTLSGYQGAAAAAKDITVTGAAQTTLNVVAQTANSKVGTLTGAATNTTVNINAQKDLSIATLAATAATKVAVSGTNKVTIAASDLAATTAVDASANSGGVSYTAEAGGSTLTFTGGTGNDSVTFAAGTFTTADKLAGGTGTDTIVVNDAAAGTISAINGATAFEVLALATSGLTVDIAQITNGINAFKVNAGNLTETFNNALATSTFTIDNSVGNTGNVTIANKVGELATNVTVDAGAATTDQTLATLTLTGAQTINLVSAGTGAGANIITDTVTADNSNIVVTGSKNLTITNAIDGTATGSKIDASAFTGVLNVTGSAWADIIIGGSKADILNGGAGKDTITGGAGNDIITVNAANQQDVLTLGDGSDSVKFAGANLAATLATSAGVAGVVRINDFVAGTDKIGLVNGGGAFTSMVLSGAQTIASAADLAAVYAGITAIAASTNAAAASGAVITVTAGAAAGTYLYVNDATGAVSNTDDMLINITGITGTLTATDFVFA